MRIEVDMDLDKDKIAEVWENEPGLCAGALAYRGHNVRCVLGSLLCAAGVSEDEFGEYGDKATVSRRWGKTLHDEFGIGWDFLRDAMDENDFLDIGITDEDEMMSDEDRKRHMLDWLRRY